MRILIAGNDVVIGDFAGKGLKEAGFFVEGARSTGEFIACARERRCAAAVIDLGRGEAGNAWLAAIATLREDGEVLPILALTADAAPAPKARALDIGADDCIAKPFAMVELIARIRALLRRGKKVAGPMLSAGDVTLDMPNRIATRAGKRLVLSRKEFELLEYLMRNAGVPLARGMIFENVWNADADVDISTNTIDVHISFLRAKIDSGRPKRERMIKTVYGYGYEFEGGDA